jgi:serine protease Do
MASFDPQEFGFEEPPPRPSTPPVRRGFLIILAVLSLATMIRYAVPYMAAKTGYAWEAGRAKAASEALARLDREKIINRASELFRLATAAVSPAVVNIHALRARRGGEAFPGLPLAGNRFNPGFEQAELGSGVVINKTKGYIVTNNHVIKEADRILVRLRPGDDVPARVVGTDPKLDLAVLQVRAEIKVEAQWGDSEQLDIGDWVLAIGSPLGLDHSVTAGIVSATERNDIGFSEYESYIQTDAAINPGNSGGPLIDLTGKVVGINTAIISKTGLYEGIGLAIPSAIARRVVENLIKEGKVTRGYVGVIIAPLNSARAQELQLPGNEGALVVEVQPGSPAETAGLRPGDVIVKLAEHDVVDPSRLRNLTASLDVGVQVPLTFYRQGQRQTVQVKIDELPPAPEVLTTLGLRVRSRGAATGGRPVLEVDQVIAGSPAFQAGLRPGMRILGVGKAPVTTAGEFEAAVRQVDRSHGLSLVVQATDGRIAQIQVGGAPRSGP